MKHKRQRRRFTKEFKLEAVELAQRSNKTIIEIAGELGIRPELLYRWNSQTRKDKNRAFPGS